MENKYEIKIGDVMCVTGGDFTSIPETIIPITQDQCDIIVRLANIVKDRYTNNVYKINDLEFKIEPILNVIYENFDK